MPTRCAALCVGVLLLSAPRSLRADSGELPSRAHERAGSFSIGPESGLVIPVSTPRLCPSGTRCIADLGWGIGVGFAYRWANGLGLGFGYEFWLMTANGVYEVTVPQMFVGTLQYAWLPNRSTHPLLRLRGGFLTLGPSFRVATLGGTVELGAGAEVELTPDAVLFFLVTGNLVRTQAFTTPADGALRGVDAALDAMIVLRLGFHFLL